jgi:hypothetical protein
MIAQGDSLLDPIASPDKDVPVDTGPPGPDSAAEFVLKHGRLPQLGVDSTPPWVLPGWLLFYVQAAEMQINGERSRWLHYLKTLEAGHLLDEPIPQIQFGHEGERADEGSGGHKALAKWADIVFEEIGSVGELRGLLDWFLWGLGLAAEAPRFSEKLNEKLYREIDVSVLLKHPYDYFGGYYAGSKTNKYNRTAFYPTPHSIVEAMVKMTMVDPGKEPPENRHSRTLTVCDPCVGTGRMLLHASNYSYCLYGMDIDAICVAASKINGALYAPWMTWPFSQRILGTEVPVPPPPPIPIVTNRESSPKREEEVHRVDGRQLRLF